LMAEAKVFTEEFSSMLFLLTLTIPYKYILERVCWVEGLEVGECAYFVSQR